MNIDLLQFKFTEAWEAQFSSAVGEGDDKDSATKFVSGVVRPFAKRTTPASNALLLFERCIGSSLPSLLKDFWNLVDLWGTVIWDVDFNLRSKSHACGDRY